MSKDIIIPHPKAPPTAMEKVAAIIARIAAEVGRDPRSGGFLFVANERDAFAIVKDIPPILRNLAPAIMSSDADRIMTIEGIPFVVRTSARSGLHLILSYCVPRAERPDRAAGSRVRMAAWSGMMDREDNVNPFN